MAMNANRNISTPPTKGNTIGTLWTMSSIGSWGVSLAWFCLGSDKAFSLNTVCPFGA